MRLIIIVAAAISSFIVISLVIFQSTRKTYPGFARWTAGVGCLTVGYLAFALRGFIPDSVSIFIGNAAFPLGMVFLLDGLRRFLGATPMSGLWYALPTLDLVAVAVFYYLHDSPLWRSVVTAIAISAPHWPMAALIFRHPIKHRSIFYPVIGTLLVLAGSVVLVRSVAAFFLPQWHLLMDSPFQVGALVTLVVLQLGESLSLMMLNSERVESELVEAEAQLRPTVDRLEQSLTEQKRVEESLRESEERYRNFFDTSRDCVFMTTVDGRFVEVNDVALEVFGYAPSEKQELLQRKVASFYANPEEREAHAAMVLRKGFSKEYPVDMTRKDGTIIHALITTVARRDLHGNVIGFQGTVRDVTEARKTGEALRDKTRELGERVKELRCLYGISELVENQKVSLEESLQSILNLIPPAWQYPEVTCARIILNDAEFTTENYGEPVSKQSAHLIVLGEICGALEVGYLENKPERDEGPFVKEERSLINAIAERLGRVVERMRAEEALRKEREFTETALDSQRDTFFLFEPAIGRATRWNRAFRDITGYTDEEIAAMPAPDSYYSPEDLERARMCMQEILDTGTSTIELELICKDGRKIPTEYDASVVKDLDGTPKYIVSIGRDITERKRAEDALLESEETFRSVFEHSPDGIILGAPDGRAFKANQAACRMLGRSEEEIREVGRDGIIDLTDPRLLSALEERMRTGRFSGEITCKRKDGTTFAVEGTSGVFKNAQGELRTCMIFRDITEKKRFEMEKENLQAQLIQSQKMEAIGTLTGGIAHDFNNLLTIINGYTEMILMEKSEDDPIYEDLQKILQTGRKGADMVQRLLAFSKRAEISLQPLDLNRVVENSVNLMEGTFPKMIEIETILSTDLDMVNADAAQVEQVVMNLCINAKEAMPDGGHLTIETRNITVDEDYCRLHVGAKPGRCVLIEVSDTGLGMSKETMDRVFDPFFTTKGWDFKKGTGLSLPVAKGIVEQHGGWITCRSELGKGTTFAVYLPAIYKSMEVRKPETSTETIPSGERILLVDDEEYVRDLGKRILERSGYRVIVAASGREALDIYGREQSSIALVILDLVMPQMQGAQCLEELLKINPTVKVIVSTGHSLSAAERDRFETLAKGFVNKPYEVTQMVLTVRDALGAG